MNVTNYPNYCNIQQLQVQPATTMEQLVSMLNKKMEANSPNVNNLNPWRYI